MHYMSYGIDNSLKHQVIYYKQLLINGYVKFKVRSTTLTLQPRYLTRQTSRTTKEKISAKFIISNRIKGAEHVKYREDERKHAQIIRINEHFYI